MSDQQDCSSHSCCKQKFTKGIFYFFSGVNFFDHSIKGDSELPDLIIRFDGYRDRKMSGLDRRCPFGETA